MIPGRTCSRPGGRSDSPPPSPDLSATSSRACRRPRRRRAGTGPVGLRLRVLGVVADALRAADGDTEAFHRAPTSGSARSRDVRERTPRSRSTTPRS
ncbi:MAG: hypothetical protein U5R31_02730 [Acidimicrobiia bacterium]|nr:hypothetical protein [Acidimicrobiia bacterium]